MEYSKRYSDNISNNLTKLIQRIEKKELEIKKHKVKFEEESKKRKEQTSENRELKRKNQSLEHQNNLLTEKLNNLNLIQNEEGIAVKLIVDYAIDLDDKEKAFVVISMLNELYNGKNKREAVKQIRNAYKNNKVSANYFMGEVKKITTGVEYNIEGNFENIHDNAKINMQTYGSKG